MAEERSFTAAARRLHTSQQSVSALVRRLELKLGVILFERSTRLVVPTRECAELLPDVRSALGMLDAALAKTLAGRLPERPLRLAFSPAMTFGTLQDLLDLLERTGLVVADVREIWADELPAALLAGRFDAAIAVELRSGAEISLLPWRHQRVDLLVSTDHRFAGRSEVGVEELADVTLVLPDPVTNVGFHDRLAAAWEQAGICPTVKVAPRVAGPAPACVERGEAASVWLSSMDDRYVPNGLTHVAVCRPEISVTTYFATAAVGTTSVPLSMRRMSEAIEQSRDV